MTKEWRPIRRGDDERGTYASAVEAIRLFRTGRVDEAEDLNPMAIDMFRAWLEVLPAQVAEDQTLRAMFGEESRGPDGRYVDPVLRVIDES